MSELYDHEAEACVLSAMMLDKMVVAKAIEELIEEDFSRQSHKYIFKALSDLFSKYIEADLVTVTNQLKMNKDFSRIGGLEGKEPEHYLNDLSDVVMSGANAKFHVDIIKDKSMLRKAEFVGKKLIMEVRSGKNSVEVIDNARQMLYDIDTAQVKHDYTALEAVTKTTRQTEEHITTGKPVGLGTGIHDLDYFIILKPGNLITIASKKGIGKTMLANQIAFYNVLDGKKVVFFNMEMEAEEMINREISRKGRIDMSLITRAELTEEDHKKYLYQADVLADSSFIIDDNGKQTISQIHSRIIKYKTKLKGLDLVVIDYFQLVRGGSGDSRQQKLGDISRDTKALAKHFGVPIIALSQLNNEGSTREAEDFENDSDIVLKLYRPAYDKVGVQTKDGVEKIKRDGKWVEPEENFAKLVIAKNRNGKLGSVRLTVNAEYQQFNGWGE